MDFVNKMREALGLLAADAGDQLRYLSEIGVAGVVDELALEFDDLMTLAQSRLDQGDITEVQYEKLRELDQKLSDMSGSNNASLWTEEALRTSDEWKEVRRLARSTLDVFGTEQPGKVE